MAKLTPLLLWGATFVVIYVISQSNPLFAIYLALGLAVFYLIKYLKNRKK